MPHTPGEYGNTDHQQRQDSEAIHQRQVDEKGGPLIEADSVGRVHARKRDQLLRIIEPVGTRAREATDAAGEQIAALDGD